uniref:C-type lectin domain-containing protein n=1 Tax=Sinocyclocheilus grahami TaxID=75366 RepID=A0A672SG50_SINGR
MNPTCKRISFVLTQNWTCSLIYTIFTYDLALHSFRYCVCMLKLCPCIIEDKKSFFNSGICSKSSCTRQYHLVFESKTWTEAQRYCRQNYTDLATIENMEEMRRLIKTVRGTFYGSAWIGLYDDLNNWRWSLDNEAIEGGFKSWFIQQPRNSDGQSLCVYMTYYQGTWGENFCMETFPFVCYDGENSC